MDKLCGDLPDRCCCPITQRARFPGLSRLDTEVLCSCLEGDALRPEAWWFNVPLGDVPPWAHTVKLPVFYASQAHLTQMRADVVCVCKGHVWVIEIKPEARATALGQALLNAWTFSQGIPDVGPASPAILCRWAAPELVEFCAAHGVFLHVTGG